MVIEARDRHIDDLTNDATPEASDHQRICARAPPHPLALSLSVCLASAPRPAIICYVRDSKLTAILAFCHSYVSPGRPSPDTWSRRTAIAIVGKDFLLECDRSDRSRQTLQRSNLAGPHPRNGNKETEVSSFEINLRSGYSWNLSLVFQFSTLSSYIPCLKLETLLLSCIYITQ